METLQPTRIAGAAAPAVGRATLVLVELEFSEPVESTGALVVITDPADRQVDTGRPDVVDGSLTQATTGAGPAGRYALAYRVVSADGHPISGELGFTVETASETRSHDGPVGDLPGNRPSSDADPASSTAADSSAGSFVSRHGAILGLVAIGLVAAAVVLGVGVRGRHQG